MILHEENVLGLDVSVENAVPVHVVYGLEQLVHVVFDSVFGQVVSLALDRVVHVHVHELEDEGESARRLITKLKTKCLASLIGQRY